MIPRSHKRDFGVILEPHGSSLSIFRKYENLPPDDVSVQQMIIKNAISLCWRTMIIMTRRASSVLPESNTGEGDIDAEYHP